MLKMDRQQIIMNFSVAPSADDLRVIADEVLSTLPEEIAEFCEELAIQIEEIPDTATERELDVSNPYELIALFRKGGEIAPGVLKKVANDDDILIVYRRSFLDMWCETGEDIMTLMRQVMIEELAQHFDFTDDEIEEMTRRSYQGLL